MVCKVCGKNVGRHGGHFNKHLLTEHSIIDYKTYVIKTEYENIQPKCLCGCGLEPNFHNGNFKKYCHGHNCEHIFQLNRDIDLEKKIINMYENGILVKDIIKNINLGRHSIYNILKIYGVSKSYSESKKIYKINEFIFEKINTEEKAYWLGFLYADGYNLVNKSSVTLCLSNMDYNHLIKFSNFLETDKKIRRNNETSSKVVIENKKISFDLKKHGVIQAKTHTLSFPEVPLHLEKHFIRGYFDGDGCITYGKDINNAANVTITSNKNFLIEIDKRIDVHFSYTKRHKFRNDEILTINCGGICNLLKFYSYIYDDSNIYLERKRNKFVDWFDNYFKTVKIRKKTLDIKNKVYI